VHLVINLNYPFLIIARLVNPPPYTTTTNIPLIFFPYAAFGRINTLFLIDDATPLKSISNSSPATNPSKSISVPISFFLSK
jgi:hypothetical protein